jgi:flagellin-like hook-associated protein FlgL
VKVTQKMMIDAATRNLSANVTMLLELQAKMSSGRWIQKPSEGAMGVTRDLSYRSQISDIEQFKKNISWGKSWLGMVEQTLGSAANFINEAKEIATARMLERRASVGAKVIRPETTDDRLTELNLSVTKLLSEVEDADVLAVSTELAVRQNVYQAALNATARIIQPSLIDFIN